MPPVSAIISFSSQRISARFRRFLESSSCNTPEELIVFLGISYAAFSDAQRRCEIPLEWLLTLLQKRNVNPFWVITGEGARFLYPMKEDTNYTLPLVITEYRPPEECSIEELAREIIYKSKGM